MTRDAVPIGEVLGKLLRKLGLERRTREARIALEWERVVGDTIARHSKPAGVRGKTLLVNVDSSVWLAELNRYFKDAMIEKIQAELGETRISDIRFRIGEIGEDAQV
jgi:predicted nucleic acid-binding Zn ribbon protein